MTSLQLGRVSGAVVRTQGFWSTHLIYSSRVQPTKFSVSNPTHIFIPVSGAIWGELGEHNCQNTWKRPRFEMFCSAEAGEGVNCVFWPDEYILASFLSCSSLCLSWCFHRSLFIFNLYDSLPDS